MRSRHQSLNKIINQNSLIFSKVEFKTKEEIKVKGQMDKMVRLLREYEEENKLLSTKLKLKQEENRVLTKGKGRESSKIVNRFKDLTETFEQSHKNFHISNQKTNYSLNNTLKNRTAKEKRSSLRTPEQPSIAEFEPSHNFQEPTVIEIGVVKSVGCKTLLVSPKEKLFGRGLGEGLRSKVEVPWKEVHSSNLKMVGGNGRSGIQSARSSLQKFTEQRKIEINNEEIDGNGKRAKAMKNIEREQSGGRKRYLSLLSSRDQYYQ